MKIRIGMIPIWITVVLLATISHAHEKSDLHQIQAGIEHQVQAAGLLNDSDCSGCIKKITQWVSIFYTDRKYSPAWVDEVGLKPEASFLINTIRNAKKEGLPREAYPIEIINQLTANAIFMTASGGSLPPDLAAQLDISLSTAFFLHCIYLSGGRMEMENLHDIQNLTGSPDQLVYELENALATHSLDILLADLSPAQEDYFGLKIAKERYEAIAASGGWTEIPKGSKLKRGVRNDRVPGLRKRLRQSEDLTDPADLKSDLFDDVLEKAVQQFQKRHGLLADGVVGPSTLEALNVPAAKRLEQILANLERWRQLPRNFEDRYIEVNVPDFHLKMVDKGKTVQTMRVVVGRRNRPTPILFGRMTYLSINPYWTVPPLIARKDLLPKIRKDPSYLTIRNIRVFENWKADAAELDPLSIDWNQVGENRFPYKLRQEPARDNALGKVKFMFPNKLNVYLHDTPSKELFKRRQRSFSAGCVRLEKPLDLAAYLLDSEKGWSREKVSSMFEKGTPQVVLFKEPIPVYILYWTAWVEKDGMIHFRKDIYGRDRALNEQLKEQLPVFKTCRNGLIPTPLTASSNHGVQWVIPDQRI